MPNPKTGKAPTSPLIVRLWRSQEVILIELDELNAVKIRHMPEKGGKWVPNLPNEDFERFLKKNIKIYFW